jgi:hypothetical protein
LNVVDLGVDSGLKEVGSVGISFALTCKCLTSSNFNAVFQTGADS